jgi:hypothetical protein
MGMEAERRVYQRLGLDFDLLDSGCCGMAGAFGFEREHYDVSMKIGERRLLPAVRDADQDTLLIADGFSCKTQVEHATDRRALHTAQILKMALDHGESGPEGSYPERRYPDVLTGDGRRDLKTAAIVGGVLADVALAWGHGRRF